MNRELMLQVADAVEAEYARGVKIKLDMRHWHGVRRVLGISCGTTACIGGFVDVLVQKERDAKMIAKGVFEPKPYDPDPEESVFHRAKEALELGEWQARELMMDTVMFSVINSNRRYVPDALRWMAVTGKVNWLQGIAVAKCAQHIAEREVNVL